MTRSAIPSITGSAASRRRWRSSTRCDAGNRPRGPRATGAPILVGSTGRRMLGIIARYADAWNTVWHGDPNAIVPQMAAVDEACRDAGRDPATLVRTAGGNIAMPGYLG